MLNLVLSAPYDAFAFSHPPQVLFAFLPSFSSSPTLLPQQKSHSGPYLITQCFASFPSCTTCPSLRLSCPFFCPCRETASITECFCIGGHYANVSFIPHIKKSHFLCQGQTTLYSSKCTIMHGPPVDHCMWHFDITVLLYIYIFYSIFFPSLQ